MSGVELYKYSNLLRQSLLCPLREQRKCPSLYEDGCVKQTPTE